jgi:sensor c-di-GMP phosphodiesterase-like protein
MKGIRTEYVFLLISLIFTIMVVSSSQQKAMDLASERMSELKVITLTQIKNILFTMQYAPVETEACASLRNCISLAIHRSYIEIWGLANDYFREDEYLSTSLVGNMNIYMWNETCAAEGREDCWVLLDGNVFKTSCSHGDQIFYLCFRKELDKNGNEAIFIKGGFKREK